MQRRRHRPGIALGQEDTSEDTTTVLGLFGKHGVPLGRLFGIDVRLDATWFLIFIFLVYMLATQWFVDIANVTTSQSWVFAILAAVLFFASLLAHEFGHALTARLFGIKTRQIMLFLFGGVAQIESEPKRPAAEFWIAIAGPAVSIALAVAFGGIWFLASNTDVSLGLIKVLEYLAAINLVLALFNLLPGFPMDGGRVLRSAVWAITGNFLFATRVAARMGRGMGWLLILWGLVGWITRSMGMIIPVVSSGGLFTALIGWFLMSLAKVSERQAEFTTLLGDLTVGDLMRPIRAVIPADTLLSDVAEHYFGVLRGDQFPVVDEDRLLGVITRDQLESVPQRQWDWTRSREIVRPFQQDAILSPGLGAMEALQVLARGNMSSLPVFQGRRLMGYVFQSDLLAAMRNRQRQQLEG